MKNLPLKLYGCLASVCLLLIVNGCEWDDALTSPGKAAVDKELLGYWKITVLEKESNGEVAVWAISECAKVMPKISHPNWPRGAMMLNFLALNSKPSTGNDAIVAWPTRIGNVSYMNATSYDFEENRLASGRDAFLILKYEVNGDDLTVYNLPAETKKQLKARLGKTYNAADLLQEITKETGWKAWLKGKRIK